MRPYLEPFVSLSLSSHDLSCEKHTRKDLCSNMYIAVETLLFILLIL